MITEKNTLEEVIAFPGLSKWGGMMIDPMMDDSLKEGLGEAEYQRLLHGKPIAQQTLEEIFAMIPAWNRASVLSGLNYLAVRAQEETIFHSIWSEEELRENAAKKQTAMAAFGMKKKSRAVIICPGGGYSSVCSIAEGYGVAEILNNLGYAAFVLKYRVGQAGEQPAPMDDLAQAVRYIFSHAEELNIDPKGYAVMGFSAGGHLAGSFGTEILGYKKYNLPRPGAVILGYPVITMGEKAHEGSREMLLGKAYEDDAKLRDRYSLEKQVTGQYPPVFLWNCDQDECVPPENAGMFADALKGCGVPYRYETYPGTHHGWSAGIGTPAEGWISRAVSFWERSLEE